MLTGILLFKKSREKVSTNDFTNALKMKLEELSSATNGGINFYIGTTQPEDANTIWFDTTDYE